MSATPEQQAARRAKARAAGKCLQCCTKPAVPGFSACARCRERNAKRIRGAIKMHCTKCNDFGHNRQNCPQAEELRFSVTAEQWCDECLCANGHREGCAQERRAA